MSRVRRRAIAIAVVSCAAAALFATGSANSARETVTSTKITTPSDASYFVYQYNKPNTFTVAGTSSGTVGDHVDIACYYGNTSRSKATSVPVNSNGTFSVPTASLADPPYTPCRLRAVPSGTTPASLAPFTGPRILVGENRPEPITSGPNSGKLPDYYLYFQQLGGGFDYGSLSGCGVCDGYLSEPDFTQSTVTFWSNAAIYTIKSGPVLRSELKVDGANAYPPESANQINQNATGLPALTYHYVQDKKTGDVVIRETDPIVKCANATFPPTPATCPSFKPAGITDTVTMVQDHSGRIAWVSDVFTSTDGHSHSLDLAWDNSQDFHGQAGNSAEVEYKFPGEKAYATHVLSDDPSIAKGPGTIWVRVHGALDGNADTGQGAIVYDQTASDAYFRTVDSGHETFMLRQKAKIPAHGSVRFRFAYVQAYTFADVAAGAKFATTVFKGCIVPKVVGKSTRAAVRLLKHANCGVGKFTLASSGTIAKGTVIASVPAAGTHLDYLAKVALIVSKG